MSITGRSPRNLNWASKSTDKDVGPGSYDLPPSFVPPFEQGIPFNSTSARDRVLLTEIPGPADYSPMFPAQTSRVVGSTMISSSPRVNFAVHGAPSPADHANQKLWLARGGKRAPMSSRTPRDLFVVNNATTSPADFDLAPPLSRGVHLGRDARFRYSYSRVPGPGAYNSHCEALRPEQEMPNSIFQSNVDRVVFKPTPGTVDSPGLGHDCWNTPEPSAPFGARTDGDRKLWTLSQNPGPADYRLRPTPLREQRAPFGARSDRDFAIADGPGPAAYSIKNGGKVKPPTIETPFMQRAPRFERTRENNEFTAPGQYDISISDTVNRIRVMGSKSPAFRTNAERKVFDIVDGPGPRYSLDAGEKAVQASKIRTRMDGAARMSEGTFIGEKIRDTPAPGVYDVVKSGVGKAYIGRGPRTGFGGENGVPSPDAYEIGRSFVKPSLNRDFQVGEAFDKRFRK